MKAFLPPFLPLLLAVAGTACFQTVQAEEAGPAAVNPVSFNAATVSDYRYRGISQTRLKPALQGGADYADSSSGFYAGTWLSSIRWTADAGGDGHVEWDIYGGRRGSHNGIDWDAGGLAYVYPSNGLAGLQGFANANTFELYFQIGSGPVYGKLSVSTTNLFGFTDSRHSAYLDIGANPQIAEGLTLNLHAGYQKVTRHGDASYADWKLGLTRDFGSFTGSLAVIGTNADRLAYASPANGRFLGRTAVVGSIATTF